MGNDRWSARRKMTVVFLVGIRSRAGRQRPYRTLLQDAQVATAVGLALPVGIGTGSGTGTVSRSLQPALVD